MNHRSTIALFAAMSFLAIPLIAHDDSPERDFRADLRGRNESPVTLSAARGKLTLTVNESGDSVHFVLEYSGLATPVTAAHIHVGQPDINGGVTVFFCGTVPMGFPPRDACPQEGTVEGDFTEADVIGLVAQQLEANNLPKLLTAIRKGQTYANVHSMTSPAGEIRGQIEVDRRKRDR
jgi:CHRD domain